MQHPHNHHFNIAVAAVIIAVPLVLWSTTTFIGNDSDTTVSLNKRQDVYDVTPAVGAKQASDEKQVHVILNDIEVDMAEFDRLYQDAFMRDLLMENIGVVNAPVALENEEQTIPFYEWDEGIRKSFFNFINKDVYATGGDKIGEVVDILVQRNHPELAGLAGTALYLIYDKSFGDGMETAEDDYAIIPFDYVTLHQADNDFQLYLSEQTADRNEFDYAALQANPDLVSLARLQAGRAINEAGTKAGDIYAVTYDDALAREIIVLLGNEFFGLPEGEHFFAVPFTEVDFRMNGEAVDIRFTDEQIRRLSRQAATEQ